MPSRTGVRHVGPRHLYHFLEEVLGLDQAHDICTSFRFHGITDLDQFINFMDEDVDKLTVPINPLATERTQVQLQPLSPTHIRWLKIGHAFWHYLSRTKGRCIDITKFTKADIDRFRISDAYDPSIKLTMFWNAKSEEELTKEELELAQWSKTVKPNKSDYVDFRDETAWQLYKEQFLITIKSHGLAHVIDETYSPRNIELDKAQSNWIFSVFMSKFKIPTAKKLIKKYQKTQNARMFWKELCEALDDSFTTELYLQKLSTFLTSFRLGTSKWRGTQESFILVWAEKARQYNEMAEEPYKDNQLIGFLNTCVSGVSNLAPVLMNYRTSTRAASTVATSSGTTTTSMSRLSLTFEEFVRLLQLQAQVYDGARNVARNPRTSANIHESVDDDDNDSDNILEAFSHDYEFDPDELMAMQHSFHQTKKTPNQGSPKKVYLPSDIWKSMSKEDQKFWAQVSEISKAMILNYGAKRGHVEANVHSNKKEPELRSVHEHDLIFDEDPPTEAANHEIHKTETESSDLDDIDILINQHNTKSGHLGIDINQVLSTSNKKASISEPNREVNSHEFAPRSDYSPEVYAHAYEPNAKKLELELQEHGIESNLHDVGGIEINGHEFVWDEEGYKSDESEANGTDNNTDPQDTVTPTNQTYVTGQFDDYQSDDEETERRNDRVFSRRFQKKRIGTLTDISDITHSQDFEDATVTKNNSVAHSIIGDGYQSGEDVPEEQTVGYFMRRVGETQFKAFHRHQQLISKHYAQPEVKITKTTAKTVTPSSTKTVTINPVPMVKQEVPPKQEPQAKREQAAKTEPPTPVPSSRANVDREIEDLKKEIIDIDREWNRDKDRFVQMETAWYQEKGELERTITMLHKEKSDMDKTIGHLLASLEEEKKKHLCPTSSNDTDPSYSPQSTNSFPEIGTNSRESQSFSTIQKSFSSPDKLTNHGNDTSISEEAFLPNKEEFFNSFHSRNRSFHFDEGKPREDVRLVPKDTKASKWIPPLKAIIEDGVTYAKYILPDKSEITINVLHSRAGKKILEVYNGYPDGYWRFPDVHSDILGNIDGNPEEIPIQTPLTTHDAETPNRSNLLGLQETTVAGPKTTGESPSDYRSTTTLSEIEYPPLPNVTRPDTPTGTTVSAFNPICGPKQTSNEGISSPHNGSESANSPSVSSPTSTSVMSGRETPVLASVSTQSTDDAAESTDPDDDFTLVRSRKKDNTKTFKDRVRDVTKRFNANRANSKNKGKSPSPNSKSSSNSTSSPRNTPSPKGTNAKAPPRSAPTPKAPPKKASPARTPKSKSPPDFRKAGSN